MARYAFDCETDGLLDTLTKVHSLVLTDVDTRERISCHDGEGFVPVEKGLKLLMGADEAIGHNVIKFDIPALTKVYPWFKLEETKVKDTLVLSRLIWSNIKDHDFRLTKVGRLPGKLIGSHSLRAWGYRLGNLKGDFSHTDDQSRWDVWTPEMQSYCEQDVEVTLSLWDRVVAKDYSPEAIELEHEVAWLMAQMERNGFAFDTQAAGELYGKLCGVRSELETKLRETFKPWWAPAGVVKPQRTINYKNRLKPSITEGAPYTKIKLVEFNPASRAHAANRLITLFGWEPVETTDGGDPKVDEAVLSKLEWPEAKLLAEYYLIQKRIGQLAEGDQAWLKVERAGFIHGSINPNGAVTGRATHAFPNIAQVPKVGSKFGSECRGLFHAPAGWVLMGCDASGLELRCLAHFMAKWDDGAYMRVLLEGDIHWANVQAMGLTNENRNDEKVIHKLFRNGGKTFIYGFLYGAGDEKAGKIVFDIVLKAEQLKLPEAKAIRKLFFGDAETIGEDELKLAGKRLKRSFLKKTPALRALRDAVKAAAKRGWLKGLDGRQLHIRSDHAALNTLLQSAGALLCKKWIVLFDRELRARGFIHGWNGDYAFCAWVHDEIQVAIRPEHKDVIGKIAVECIKKAGEHFKFRCPLDGEYKYGITWADTH